MFAGARCRPCPQGWMWSEKHCYYLSAEAQAWEASHAFCSAHHATLPLLSHTQVRRGRWAWGGYRYRSQISSTGRDFKDLVQLYIMGNVTKAWEHKVTMQEHQTPDLPGLQFTLHPKKWRLSWEGWSGVLPSSLAARRLQLWGQSPGRAVVKTPVSSLGGSMENKCSRYCQQLQTVSISSMIICLWEGCWRADRGWV